MKENDKRNNIYRTLFSGSLAHVLECFVMHPLDSIKTRLQLAHLKPGNPTTISGSFLQMLKHGGFVEIYRGLLPAAGMQAPRGMIKFVTNNTVLGKLSKDAPTTSSAAVAGFIAGSMECFFITPFELVKVRLQAQTNLSNYTNTFDVIAKIAQTEGILSLWNGIEATMLRSGSWHCVYFSLIHIQREQQKQKENFKNYNSTKPKTQNTIMSESFVQGSIAGTCGSFFSNPIDVCKSRLQEKIGSKERLFFGMGKIFIQVFREEGIKGLYKGFLAKVLRLGPGGGLLLLFYDQCGSIYDQLFDKF